MDALEWGDGDLCHVPMVRDVVDGRVEGALDAQDVHDQLTVMDVLDEGNDDQFHVLVARGVLDVHENDSLDAHESHDQSTARTVLESRDEENDDQLFDNWVQEAAIDENDGQSTAA